MFLGWLTAAVVLGGLYLAGTLVGAIGRNTTIDGQAPYSLNDWPFAANGTWSLVADLSVYFLGIVVTTVAVAWRLRERFATVSEGRLGVVIIFSGGVPFVTSKGGAVPLLFLIAVWVVRAWVVRDELRFPRRPLAAIGAMLVITIASYGLLHPVWIESASATTSMPRSKRPTVLLMLHNSSRATIEIGRVDGGLFVDARAGWPWAEGTALPVRIPGGHSAMFTVRKRAEECGDGLVGSVRYRIFGRTLREPLRVALPELPGCS
jgi:hypothetical protein